ncbi:MAG: hypothetical protein ATN35_11385 [Epulopiscium sp. Nele67-Bin004]|nr:MAG: hypothetical protein ATN35_11385 [Epulopiscium sp. Nele67-Bin004]
MIKVLLRCEISCHHYISLLGEFEHFDFGYQNFLSPRYRCLHHPQKFGQAHQTQQEGKMAKTKTCKNDNYTKNFKDDIKLKVQLHAEQMDLIKHRVSLLQIAPNY